MCAQFVIKATLEWLLNGYGAELPDGMFDINWPDKILPHQSAPVLTKRTGARVLSPMNFSLIPSFSKTRRPEFATHNARLETIDSKPTWRGPFKRHHAIVPMTHFIEPIYEGAHAGNMVRFFSDAEDLLSAAAVYDRWKDPQSGEMLESFAVITGDPGDFVKKIGHDRQPIFLDSSGVERWLTSEGAEAADLKAQLQTARVEPKFRVENDRPMKPGWEKRRKTA